jgi:superfamily II DNA or RNA helicase
LMDFSSGKICGVVSVDVMNEGIDVPDINLMVFLRATHSRRIFVQQLGRGLRISSDKSKVIVLDFVSDVRRMAEVSILDKELKHKRAKNENVFIKHELVQFSDKKVQTFIEAWIEDVANLNEIDESEKLKFPEGV